MLLQTQLENEVIYRSRQYQPTGTQLIRLTELAKVLVTK